MADYNSAYTGAEIDAAVGAMTGGSVSGQQLVWDNTSGTPPTSVAMSAIPVNPDTGDKRGVYTVIYSQTSADVDTSAGVPNSSVLYIGDVNQNSGGSGHSDMSNTHIYISHVNYGSSQFNCVVQNHAFSSGTATTEGAFIHKIFRLQSVV